MTGKPTEPGTVLFKYQDGEKLLRVLQGVGGAILAVGGTDGSEEYFSMAGTLRLPNLELRRLREALEKAGE